MKGATEPSQWPHVSECNTAKGMWDTWKKIHVDNQQNINVHYSFEELYTKKYVDGTPIADHIAKMLDIRNRIIAAGEELPDIHVARALVLSLPKTQTWELIKIQLFGLDKLTSEIVRAVVVDLLQQNVVITVMTYCAVHGDGPVLHIMHLPCPILDGQTRVIFTRV